jgi:uncharacterized membrane protein YfcA
MDFLGTPDVGALLFAGLCLASFVTAFIGVFTGAAGGVILLALMAMVMPPTAVIPVHTVVMLGTGLSRTVIMWRFVMRDTLAPFILGAAVGAAAGAKVFVALPMAWLQAILGGFILLVIPGIWVAVRCYFATQAAALDGLAPPGAMRRSGEVVKGSWWRTLGCLLMTGLLVGVTAEIATAILGGTGSGALYVAGRIVFQAIAVAVSAVFATLLYYDLRARHERRALVGD